jgi:hypothetical protein
MVQMKTLTRHRRLGILVLKYGRRLMTMKMMLGRPKDHREGFVISVVPREKKSKMHPPYPFPPVLRTESMGSHLAVGMRTTQHLQKAKSGFVRHWMHVPLPH